MFPDLNQRAFQHRSTAFGYSRISHADQEAGESTAAQNRRTKQYWELNLQPNGIEWGGIFEEPTHVSASRVPFERRKAGQKLMTTLRPGDHVIFDKVDRVWRSNSDFVDLQRWFLAHEITYHFTNMMGCSVQSGTPMGEFMLGLFVLVAQLEAAQVSDRTKGALKHERSNGLFPLDPRLAPIGTKAVVAVPKALTRRGKPKRCLVWDTPMRILMAEIVKLHDVDGLTWLQISDQFTARFEKYVSIHRNTRVWSVWRVRHAYRFEKAYQAVLDPRYMDLKTIPKPEIILPCSRVRDNWRDRETLKRLQQNYRIQDAPSGTG